MKRMQTICLICLFGLISLSATAQSEVASTNMLYNAPYRHMINPAFEPLTDGYVYIPALSHIALYAGNNSFSLDNWAINQGGKMMWTLNPESTVNPLAALRENTLFNVNTNIALLGFGARTKKGNYWHAGINERIDAGVTLPKDLFNFVLGGGMTDLDNGNVFNLSSLGAQMQVYTELVGGYSRHEREIWTWGAKLKVLLGHAYMGMQNEGLMLNANPDMWTITGTGNIRLAAPLDQYPSNMDGETLFDGSYKFQDHLVYTKVNYLINGYGAAFDAGFTVKPVKILTLSASLNDIGFIYWQNGMDYHYIADAEFDGMGSFNYNDYKNPDGSFNGEQFGDTLKERAKTVYTNALRTSGADKGFLSLLTMKLNVGAELNLANDIIGIGIYSKTMLYNSRFYEEVTFGASVRPASWFNFGVSYSFLNGKWSNIGFGFGLRGGPFVLTVAADYVPLTYAAMDGKNCLPYKTQGLNAELGLGIVWGWKQKKKVEEQPRQDLEMKQELN